MSWSDRIVNRAWYKIQSLHAQASLEVSIVVLLHGSLRFVIRKDFVSIFEKCCNPQAPPALVKGAFASFFEETQKLWPVSAELLDRLVDEIELGLLACSKGQGSATFAFEIMRPDMVMEGVGGLALAEINNRLGRREPTVLSKTGYSLDPDECRVQVILSWMRLMGISNPRFLSVCSDLFFEKEWNAFHKNWFGGILTGINRGDHETLFARVRQECRGLSSSGTSFISYLCETIERLGGRLEVQRAESEAQAATAKKRQEILEAAIARTGQCLLAEADARGWQTHPKMPIAPWMTLAEWRQEQMQIAAFMIVSMAVKLERLDGIDGRNLDNLKDVFTSAYVKKGNDLVNDHDRRRYGITGSFDKVPEEIRDASSKLVDIYAKNARHCVEAMQVNARWPLHEFYRSIAPGFGQQSDEATLAARFDPVILPILNKLRRELVAAAQGVP